MSKKPSIRTLDLGIEKTWKAFAGGSRIPYLGVGAHADWADAESGSWSPKLYATYKAAAEWIVEESRTRPRRWSRQGARPTTLKAMAALIRANERLAMSLAPAGEVRKEIEAVYKAGIDVGYFPAHAVERTDLRQADADDPQSAPSRQRSAGGRQHARAAGRLADRLAVLPALPVSAGAATSSRARSDILLSWPLLSQVLVTAVRIFAGLLGAFVLGCAARAADRPLAEHRELRHAGPGVPAGHSRRCPGW